MLTPLLVGYRFFLGREEGRFSLFLLFPQATRYRLPPVATSPSPFLPGLCHFLFFFFSFSPKALFIPLCLGSDEAA